MEDLSAGRPLRVSSVMRQLVRTRGITEESAKAHLDQMWKQTAGERIAKVSWVRKLREGVLEVAVRNGGILEELTCYLKHDLLTELQQKYPDQKISSLKFVRVNQG